MASSSRASDPSTSSNRSKKHEGEQGKDPISTLSSKLSQLKKQIQASRLASIKEKIEANRKNLQRHTCELFDDAAAVEAATRTSANQPKGENLLSARAATAPCRLGGWDWVTGMGEKEIVHTQEEVSASGMLMIGSSASNKSGVRFVKLPYVEKIPPYMTWIFLDKNQRMAEDQSVVGRRRIYYDQFGNEALICSDSDEEIAVPEEEKHEFTEGEDQILRKAFEEHGLNEEVLSILCQFIDASPDEIEERCGTLGSRNHAKHQIGLKVSDEEESAEKLFHDKTLNAALDSFDYLFCRRCLVFDCRLHECSLNVIIPSEKQSFGIEQEENRRPCGSQCYLRGRKDVQDQDHSIPDVSIMHEKRPQQVTKEICVSLPLDSEDSNPVNEKVDPINYEGICTKISRVVTISPETSERSKMLTPEAVKTSISVVPVKSLGKRKTSEEESSSEPNDEHFLVSAEKKQKPLAFSGASHADERLLGMFPISSNKCLDNEGTTPDQPQKDSLDESVECLSRIDISAQKNVEIVKDVKLDSKKGQDLKNLLVTGKEQSFNCWNTMEKDLYLKGIEIFGKNSCLIARNLLSGLKTCLEVANYMFSDGASTVNRPSYTNLCQDDSGMEDQEYMEQEMPIRTRILRRRGRARKLKYTWKSAGHPSIRKRISNGKQQSCKQYTPCGCQQMCGKECSCMIDGTCCEKYCGCSKSCKNRFRGCHCAKSQCRSRQCPCFAAGRECDPDVCRNCWVSCGDGSLGEPPARGDGYQCGNMNLLLKQKKRILLARSDIAGWGAFIKNPVNKNDYLGEYTGELISHKEADKRGKIYDRANSSFLFDLNDKFVLDAYRKGDKLKFANHSSNPNCYAKVMLVAGDHRVGIFAKERIEACEELFYDYRYGPDQAPAWARKPEGSKKDDSTTSHSRAHKVA